MPHAAKAYTRYAATDLSPDALAIWEEIARKAEFLLDGPLRLEGDLEEGPYMLVAGGEEQDVLDLHLRDNKGPLTQPGEWDNADADFWYYDGGAIPLHFVLSHPTRVLAAIAEIRRLRAREEQP